MRGTAARGGRLRHISRPKKAGRLPYLAPPSPRTAGIAGPRLLARYHLVPVGRSESKYSQPSKVATDNIVVIETVPATSGSSTLYACARTYTVFAVGTAAQTTAAT